MKRSSSGGPRGLRGSKPRLPHTPRTGPRGRGGVPPRAPSGRPAAGGTPLRGQNNVQGASDVGVLPDVFSGYRTVSDDAVRAELEQRWGRRLPQAPGLTVVEMVNAASHGSLKGMYLMGENPMVSDPDLNHVREALSRLEFMVSQEIFLTETAAMADVILPATSHFEKDGTTTNTERRGPGGGGGGGGR